MIGNYINALGLELEGPFKKIVELDDKIIREFKDEVFNHPVDAEGVKYLKECVSHPLWYKSHIDEYFNIISSAYMEKAVTVGMGYHIHFSLSEPKYYEILFSKKFVTSIQRELFKVFPKDEALQARPSYRSPSRTNFFKMEYPAEYFRHGIEKKRHNIDREERYYFINFWRAYRDHGTFEIRIFPATTITQMKAYTEFTINFIEKYIKDNLNDDEVSYKTECNVEKMEKLKRELYCGKKIHEETDLLITRRT